jgi:hypothetical protein
MSSRLKDLRAVILHLACAPRQIDHIRPRAADPPVLHLPPAPLRPSWANVGACPPPVVRRPGRRCVSLQAVRPLPPSRPSGGWGRRPSGPAAARGGAAAPACSAAFALVAVFCPRLWPVPAVLSLPPHTRCWGERGTAEKRGGSEERGRSPEGRAATGRGQGGQSPWADRGHDRGTPTEGGLAEGFLVPRSHIERAARHVALVQYARQDDRPITGVLPAHRKHLLNVGHLRSDEDRLRMSVSS